jgi:NADP-dependent 3-hydroxy acid dehydrogenase YdfG
MARHPLAGRGVVVTGAASGIGEALAHGLVARGARVLLADLHAERLAAVAEAIAARGGDCVPMVLDVADPEAAQALAARAQAAWGGADVLVNNAGVSLIGPVDGLPERDAQWLMDVNFNAVVRGCRAFLPQLRARRGSAIVNVSSVFAMVAPPTQSMYAASKAAVRAFSDVLREEVREAGVRVLLVHPGGIRTRIVESARVVDTALVADSHAALARRFEAAARTSAPQAAEAMLRALERGDERLLIGVDARLGDAMFRLAPGRAGAWFTALANRLRR